MHEKLKSPFIKILLVFLLCLSGALTIWCASGIYYFKQDLFSEETDFFASRQAESISRTNADHYVRSWYADQLHTELPYIKNYTNTEVAVYLCNQAFDYDLGFWSGDTYSHAYTYYFFHWKTEQSDYVQIIDEDPALMQYEPEINQAYGKVIIYVDDTFPKEDNYAAAYRIWKVFEPYRKLYLPGLLLSVAVFISALIQSFRSAGKVQGSDEIKLYWFDKIPFELVLAAMAFAWLLTFLIFKEIFESIYSSLALPGQILVFTIMAMLLSLYFFTVLMTMTRRIKAKTFLQTSLCGYVYYLWKKLPLKVAVILTAALYLVFRILLILEDSKALLLLSDLAMTGIILLMLANGAQLYEASGKLAAGDLNYRISDEDLSHMHWFFKTAGENLNSIATGMNNAVEEQMRSERMKTDLITNVSHDIKTPLTSVINYVDLLQKEHTEEEEKEYLEVLSRSSGRLKKLCEDIVEASRASSGNITVEIEKTNAAELIGQALAEYEEKLQQVKLTPVVNIPEDLYVMADGRQLWRILSNLLSNCTKYAMPDTRVYIDANKTDDGRAVIAVKNISKEPLNISADELMERFVRGDEARSSEGSGLGLNIAASLARLMDGELKLTVDGDFFKAEAELPAAGSITH